MYKQCLHPNKDPHAILVSEWVGTRGHIWCSQISTTAHCHKDSSDSFQEVFAINNSSKHNSESADTKAILSTEYSTVQYSSDNKMVSWMIHPDKPVPRPQG